MTRDDALFIARRIMDRNREDGAEHLDSIADEILAGEAIIESRMKPVITIHDLSEEPSEIERIYREIRNQYCPRLPKT